MLQNDILSEILSRNTEIANAMYHSEYKVAFANDLLELEKLVNEHLMNDWQCLGGVAVSTMERTYLQAMVK